MAETTDLLYKATDGGSNRPAEDDNGQPTASPPQDVFQSFGLMELEKTACCDNMDSDDAHESEDDFLEEEEGDEELGGGFDAATAADGGCFEPCGSFGDKIFYPKFNGKFIEYETEGDSDQEIKNLTTSSVCSDDAGEDSEYRLNTPKRKEKKKKKYAIILVSFLAIISAVYYLSRGNGQGQSDPVSLMTISAKDAPPSTHHHKHPEKHHSHNRATTCTSRHHDHDQKHDHNAHHSTQANTTLTADPSLRIKASAVATIQKSNPENRWSGQEELCIERDERISFIRFDLSPSLSEEDVVTRATLNIYLKTASDKHTVVVVDVDMLPHGGEWNDQSVSWYNPPWSKGAYAVNSFHAVCKQTYEVDVTSAIRTANNKSVTFKLSTESSGDLWFASKRWNGGAAVPELAITLAA